tara:strand:+ start:299 stop:469 length:171 start_codon:yes stop_codon:yes gene_type:complete
MLEVAVVPLRPALRVLVDLVVVVQQESILVLNTLEEVVVETFHRLVVGMDRVVRVL